MFEIRIAKDELTPTLEIISDRLGDMSSPIETVLTDGLFSAQAQIVEGQGELFGAGGWKEMSEVTIKKGRTPGTLELDTGAQLLSFNRGGAGNFLEAGPNEGSAGTRLVSPRNTFPYPYWQHKGTDRYPGRPSLVWYEERLPDYDLVFLDWFLREEAL